MKVLVTGATSLLGAATVRRLLRAGHEVRTFQRNPSFLETDEALGTIDDEEAVKAAADGVDASA